MLLGLKKIMINIVNIHFQDNSGTIENEELTGFLKDLLSLAKKVKKIKANSDTKKYFLNLQWRHLAQKQVKYYVFYKVFCEMLYPEV